MPKHDFVVETRSIDDNFSYSSYSWDFNGRLYKQGLTEADYVSIDDEFIIYINDSLNWIPTWDPSTRETGNGLNNYGVTVIGDINLLTFKAILQAWMNMFECAPERIALTGSYEITAGQYERLEYDKPDLLMKLKKLIRLADRALNEDKCILHLGI